MRTIPALYEKMDAWGMLDYRDSRYLWVFDMKWIPVKKLSPEPEIYVGDMPLTTFARGMGGDYWCFLPDANGTEPAVCFCEHTEPEGSVFASSLPDAIFREIVFYGSTACFDDAPTTSPANVVASNEEAAHALFRQYAERLKDILNDKQIAILKELAKKPLTWQTTPYGEWHALLSDVEVDQILSAAIQSPKPPLPFPIRWTEDECEV